MGLYLPPTGGPQGRRSSQMLFTTVVTVTQNMSNISGDDGIKTRPLHRTAAAAAGHSGRPPSKARTWLDTKMGGATTSESSRGQFKDRR